MTMLPSTHRPAMRTTIPAGTTELPNGTCNGLGRVALPTTDGGVQTFICDGCSACRRPVVVRVAVPAVDLEASEALRRRIRIAQAFDATADDEAF